MDRKKRLDIFTGLLAIDTTNGNEEASADYISKVLAEHGIESHKVPCEPGRANCVAEIGKGDRVLAVSGHMDVVSPGALENWDTPPFEPTEKDGKIYARGAADMKSGLAAMVAAMIELVEEKAELGGRVRLMATVGEEIGLIGAKKLTDEGYAKDVEAMIIGEPSGLNIVYAHKGVLSYRVVSHGKSAHSSIPEQGINAIDNLIVFYNEMMDAFSKLTEENEALGRFVYNNSIISGGDQINMVPAKAELRANLRTTPEVNSDILRAILQEIVDRLNKSVKGMNLVFEEERSTQAVFSDKNSKLVTVAQREATALFGQPLPLVGSPGGTDAAEFVRGNKDMQVIIFGPGNESLHQANEYVEIENYLQMIDLYKKIIVSYFA